MTDTIPKDPQNGYPALARVMVYPGMSMFKKFAELNMRNLLYMQAEILDLERELHIVAGMDNTSSQESVKEFATSALALRSSAEGGNGSQWELVLQIREKLKKYSN
jgi:hypothetical protein